MCNPSSTGGPAGELKEAIESSFGSVDAMKDKFNAAAAGEWAQVERCRAGVRGAEVEG
jgi:Fe-Mn family superoxide dismutase